MKRNESLRLIIGLMFTVLFLSACGAPSATPTPKPTPTRGLGEPSDYFPTEPGMAWVYKIEIGRVEPLSYQEVTWPLGNGRGVTYAQRGRFVPLLRDEERKVFALAVRVLGPAAEQGPLKYPNGVELEIVKDELGIFEYAKQVFWAITSSGRFMVGEVVTYSPDTPGAPSGAWGSFGMEDGYSLRVKFFGEEPGIQIGLGDEPKDTLLFVGFEDRVPQYEGNPCPCLHFLRTVGPAEKEEGEEQSYLDKGFTEDMWFAKGKGLVRLEQKVDGETSMIWTLDESAQTSIALPASESFIIASPTPDTEEDVKAAAKDCGAQGEKTVNQLWSQLWREK